METVFAKIVRKELPAEVVYENATVIAFLDREPSGKGHTLVVPKEWSENVFSISPEAWADVMETVRLLAPKVRDAVQASGVNILLNCGHDAGQVVLHTHAHIIPRFVGDGLKQWQGKSYQEGEMHDIAEAIRALA
jgi:histidine triad (HIT) family protein